MGTNAITGPILVVGGCGFLGHHIIQQLRLGVGDEVEIAVMGRHVVENRQPTVSYHIGDITKREDVTKVFGLVKPQVVFHTVSPRWSSAPSDLESVNVIGTQILVDSAKQIGTVKAFIYTSSSSIVHDQRNALIEAHEDMPVLVQPQQPEFYSHTKALAETIVLSANRGSGMLTASIRPALMYGEGDEMTTTNLVRQAVTGKTRYIIGDGKVVFDTCYVKNCAYAQVLLAQALITATEAPSLSEDNKIDGEAYFVTDDEHVLFWGFRLMASEMAGYPVKEEEVKSLPRWLLMLIAWLMEWIYWLFTLGTKKSPLPIFGVRIVTMERTICINKIKERLGYRPIFAMRKGLKRAVEWRLESMDLNGRLKAE